MFEFLDKYFDKEKKYKPAAEEKSGMNSKVESRFPPAEDSIFDLNFYNFDVRNDNKDGYHSESTLNQIEGKVNLNKLFQKSVFDEFLLKGNAGVTSSKAIFDKYGFELGSKLNVAEVELEFEDSDENNNLDRGGRLGFSEGIGFGFGMQWNDKDGDGLREMGAKADLGPFSIGYQTEDPLGDLLRFTSMSNPLTGVISNYLIKDENITENVGNFIGETALNAGKLVNEINPYSEENKLLNEDLILSMLVINLKENKDYFISKYGIEEHNKALKNPSQHRYMLFEN